MKPLKPFEIPLENINLIEASAGTGKTYNLTSLYIRLLIETSLSVKNILVVTYTEAATKELHDRLLNRIKEAINALNGGYGHDKSGDDIFLKELVTNIRDKSTAVNNLERAVREFDQSSVYTIHGFCYQALMEESLISGTLFDSELIGDDSDIILEVADDFWRNFVYEFSNDKYKKPFLQYLINIGYEPEKLASELGPYTGLPYLEIVSEFDRPDISESAVKKLYELYEGLKKNWNYERNTIFQILNGQELSHYRESWLVMWMNQFDEWIRSDIPPINLFDKFEKFRWKNIRNSIKKGHELSSHNFFLLCDRYGEVASQLQNYEEIFKQNALAHLNEHLGTKKDRIEVLSFNDLLTRLRDALVTASQKEELIKRLVSRYPVALVDEFQDTDPIQYDIFRSLYKDSNKGSLFMIGDPKQSIYSFRGADIFAYIKARNETNQSNRFKLEHNYRSVPGILDSINGIFNRVKAPFVIDDISYEPIFPGKNKSSYATISEGDKKLHPFTLRVLNKKDFNNYFPLNKNDAVEIAASSTSSKICEFLKKGSEGRLKIGKNSLRASDIAVLVRTHHQAELMSNELRKRGINSVQYGQESVFRSQEALELELILRAVADPANEVLVRSVLSTGIFGRSANDIFYNTIDDTSWLEELSKFGRWNKMWKEDSFAHMFRSLLLEEDTYKRLVTYKGGERKLTNLLHLGELLNVYEQENKGNIRSLIKWFAGKRNDPKDRSDEEQLRLESDEQLVKIVTMHRSKGLEYPVIFCPFLWFGPEFRDSGKPIAFHDESEPGKLYLDLSGGNSDKKAFFRYKVALEELSESLRLAYVAMTRARQWCQITCIPANNFEYSPLGYLLLGHDFVLSSLKNEITPHENSTVLEKGIFNEAVKSLEEELNGLISVESIPRDTNNYFQDRFQGETESYEAKKFTRKSQLDSGNSVSSFSSMVTWMKEDPEKPDYDFITEETIDLIRDDSEKVERNRFTLPKGAKTGTCLHKILEELEYSDQNKMDIILDENLRKFGLELTWKPVVHSIIEDTLSVSLSNDDKKFTLSSIHKDQILTEMQFYYNVIGTNPHTILELIREGNRDNTSYTNLTDHISGYMKGYIDLLFQYNNRYFLLDYKTNYLGDTIDDYKKVELKKEIIESFYDLQYHIYTVAIHRYLGERLPDYSYDDHFGGVYYLFLRGLKPNDESMPGIYFHKPDKKIIMELDSYLSNR